MKTKILGAFVIIALVAVTIVRADDPPRLLPVVPNQNPKELSYSYLVVAPKGYSSMAENLNRELRRTLLDANMALYDARKIELLPDVVFVVDDGSTEVDSLVRRANGGGASVMTLKPQSTAKEAFDYLSSRYYGELRPEYSTIFTAGDGGYSNFRIPSIATTKDGVVMAFAEARAFYRDQAENDIVARRSMDGGRSWGPLMVVAEDGKNSLNNITTIYLEAENRILLMYQNYPQSMVEGMAKTDKVYMRSYIIHSDDNGSTWSKPRETTKELCPDGMQQFCTGPGVGIELTTGAYIGRLVVPCNAVMPSWFNFVAYSDDRGKSWQVADGRSMYGTNESQLVEVGEGELLVCARSHRNMGDTSSVTPEGWTPWAFDKLQRNRALIPVKLGDKSANWGVTQVRKDMPDPMCQGSIMRVGKVGDPNMLLIVANPASDYSWLDTRLYARTPPMRVNGSVCYSKDGGKSWSTQKRIYGDRFTEYQYSVLTSLGSGKVGCIFEANDDIKFVTFGLDWMMR